MDGEEENCQGKCGRTEEGNISGEVLYTVRGQWNIINRIWFSMHDLVNF